MSDEQKVVMVATVLEYCRTHGIDLKEALHLLRPEVIRWWYAQKDAPR